MCLSASKSGCVSSDWVVLSVGFSLAWTNLFFREGLFLNAITGGSGKIELRVLLFWISFQCFLITCFSLWASSQNCDEDQFLFVIFRFFLNRICCLWLNFTEFICGRTCLCL